MSTERIDLVGIEWLDLGARLLQLSNCERRILADQPLLQRSAENHFQDENH